MCPVLSSAWSRGAGPPWHITVFMPAINHGQGARLTAGQHLLPEARDGPGRHRRVREQQPAAPKPQRAALPWLCPQVGVAVGRDTKPQPGTFVPWSRGLTGQRGALTATPLVALWRGQIGAQVQPCPRPPCTPGRLVDLGLIRGEEQPRGAPRVLGQPAMSLAPPGRPRPEGSERRHPPMSVPGPPSRQHGPEVTPNRRGATAPRDRPRHPAPPRPGPTKQYEPSRPSAAWRGVPSYLRPAGCVQQGPECRGATRGREAALSELLLFVL